MCIIIKGGTIYYVYNKYIFVLHVFSSNRHLFVALFIISQAHRETFHVKARQARTGSISE